MPAFLATVFMSVLRAPFQLCFGFPYFPGSRPSGAQAGSPGKVLSSRMS
jgi:hypothetical protein